MSDSHSTEKTKKCWRCKRDLPPSEFWRDKGKADGLQACCKDCGRDFGRVRREKFPEYFRIKNREGYVPENNKTRYAKYRDRMIAHRRRYGNTVAGRLRSLVTSAISRSSKKNKPCDIDIEWVLSLYESQEGRCLLTGIPFEFTNSPGFGGKYTPFSPSLDQIIPGGGYTKTNTRLVCTAVNIALNRFGEEILEKVCRGFLALREARFQSAVIGVGDEIKQRAFVEAMALVK